MIDGYALADHFARVGAFFMLLAIFLPLLAFGVGWYCGDRLDLPSVRVEAR